MENPTDPIPARFKATEARVLACLMEKELTTPDTYPLTVNSLALACNQKTNRDPVMALTQGEVGHLANELAKQGLVKIEYGGRANRIWHRMDTAFAINRKQQAVLAVLMVREPQTLNEIRLRTERMADFDGPNEILQVLDALMEREPPLAICLPKGPGQREDRFTHTLCGTPIRESSQVRTTPAQTRPATGDRMTALEARVEDLERQVAALVKRLEGEG